MKPDRLPFAALLVAATAATLSCADHGITGPPGPDATAPAWLGAPVAVAVDPATPALLAAASKPPSGGSGGSSSLVVCSKLPYDSVTQVIGPAGGVIAVGPHFLWIDTLALPSPVTITAVAPSDHVRRIRLKPDGLVFQKTAFLVTSYANCNLKQATTPRIAQISDAMEILGYLGSASGTDTVFAKTYEGTLYVGGEMHHFSNYAVAW